MFHKIFSIILLIFISSVAFASSAATIQDGLNFEISSAAINSIGTTKYLVVEFCFTNKTGTRKIDMDSGFQYALIDNFNNHYRTLKQPKDYIRKTERLPPNFPSVYPGESCSTTLFFEAPVTQADTLELMITAQGIGVIKPIIVPFSIAPIRASSNTLSLAKKISITSPLNGAVLEKGTVFPLQVSVAGEPVPRKLLIVAFGQTFEDTSVSAENIYNIAISESTPVGQTSVNVIAHWDSAAENDQITSQSVIIFVKGEQVLTQF